MNDLMETTELTPKETPPNDLVAQIKATAILEAEVLREQLRGFVEEGAI